MSYFLSFLCEVFYSLLQWVACFYCSFTVLGSRVSPRFALKRNGSKNKRSEIARRKKISFACFASMRNGKFWMRSECVSVVCERGVWAWCVSVVRERGAWAWCVSMVREHGAWAWCVSVVVGVGELKQEGREKNKSKNTKAMGVGVVFIYC